MKGKLTLSSKEVKDMVEQYIWNKALTPNRFKVTLIKTPGYTSYDPEIEIEFSNEVEDDDNQTI